MQKDLLVNFMSSERKKRERRNKHTQGKNKRQVLGID